MRSHAKAATAGSNQRWVRGLGRIFAGVLATRHASSRGNASGASSPRSPRRLLLGALATLAAAIAVAIPAAAAGPAPAFLFQTCTQGTGAGQCNNSVRGIAAAPATAPNRGHVFVGDQFNRRLNEFTAWGGFVKSWGWNVVESGPGNTGAGEFEICVAADGDVCRQGANGKGVGQFFSAPAGAAVDSEGAVYVYDSSGRVQKFDPEGNFVLMIGGRVNKTKVALREEQEAEAEPVTVTEAEENLCTAASGDECGAAVAGSGNGQFKAPIGDQVAIDTLGTASAADDKLYVGDVERIQRFDTDGAWQANIALPGETVQSLDVGPAGNLYAAYLLNSLQNIDKENVRKLSPAGATLLEFPIANPRAVAVAASGEVYAYDKDSRKILRFAPTGGAPEVSIGEGFGNSSGEATGLATGSGCLSSGHDLYFGNIEPAFVNAYGPPPDQIELCPRPAVAPSIEAQAAISVDAGSAVVRGVVNPRFWDDTTYYVQYGPAACLESGWEAGCSEQPAAPGANLGAGVISSGVSRTVTLTGLLPKTTYHYRFVAQSSGGGPVAGVGGSEAEDGEAGTFTTYAVPAPNPDCPNNARRSGSSAHLPDCRAYELVSPADKNGGDISAHFFEGFDAPLLFPGLDQSAIDGDRIAFSSATSFADAEGAPFVSEYVASRGAGGWSTQAVNPPERGGIVNGPGNIDSQYKAFSADLGYGWLTPETGLPLTSPGPVAGFQNLYRYDIDAGALAWLESSGPEPEACADPECPNFVLFPELQGFSADGSRAVFRVNDALTPDAPRGLAGTQVAAAQLYLWSAGEGVRLVSVMPGGAPFEGSSSAGTEGGPGSGPINNAPGRTDTVDGAVSEDGTTVYWTTSSGSESLYARVNADRPQSAQAHGSAAGTGDLSVTSAFALLEAGSASIYYLFPSGSFAVGDPISGPGIPAGTTIAAVTELNPFEGELEISAPATETVFGGEIVSGSTTVTNVTTATGAFAAGQTIKGVGIPPGTTVQAVGAGTLNLSKAATAGGVGVSLEAFSECAEPDKACTIPVSESVSSQPARFWAANRDGSRALFSVGETLYEFDLEAGEATQIAAQVPGVAGASEDLSRIYFASEEVLSGEAQNSEGEAAQAGEPNLYLDNEGTIGFLATLAGEDVSLGGSFGFPSPLAAVPRRHLARVSPDGRHLAFVSAARLTAYDNADIASGKADREVYLYDADSGELSCASCNPSGARPAGADLRQGTGKVEAPGGALWVAAWIPSHQFQLHARRPLSDDGDRLFFNSLEALTPHDTNGAQDVYEWEAPGAGDCTTSAPAYSPANEGCVSLISSGANVEDSEFVDASASGEDVFIRTSSSFDPADPGLIDIYDARVNGGFAPLAERAACEGETCQAPSSAPRDATPASATFRGAGNLSAARSCSAAARRTARLSRRAKALRRRARRLSSPRRSARLRRRSARLAGKAKRLRASAKRCRGAKRRAAR